MEPQIEITVELTKKEAGMLQMAMWEKYDLANSEGETELAKEWKQIHQKINEANK